MGWTWKSTGPDNFNISFVTLFLTFVSSVRISGVFPPCAPWPRARLFWIGLGVPCGLLCPSSFGFRAARILAGCFVARWSKTTAGMLPPRAAHPAKTRSSVTRVSIFLPRTPARILARLTPALSENALRLPHDVPAVTQNPPAPHNRDSNPSAFLS